MMDKQVLQVRVAVVLPRPGSSSLIHPAAVMCIAQTRATPSAMPESRTASATSSVIWTNSRRREVLKVR